MPRGGWSGAVRFCEPWSDQPACILFIATDAAGEVQGVQRVNIDCQGRKLGKSSRGDFAETGAVVRLPGPAEGPFLLAEGPKPACQSGLLQALNMDHSRRPVPSRSAARPASYYLPRR